MAPGIEIRVEPLIDGEWRASASSERFSVVTPSTGKLLMDIPVGSEADVDRAVASARSAFEDGRWNDTPPSIKKRVLLRLAELIEAEAADLDLLDAEEMGKPIALLMANAQSAARLIRYYAELLDKVVGEVFTSDRTTTFLQCWVARGVVAAIVPWNFPTYNAAIKIAPALAAGNSLILKPSELASRSSIRLAQLALEAGLPPGVLNVVPGLGTTVGRALGLHRGVDMLAFTGSSAVGKKMLEYSAQSNMKRVLAECGGKSPQIIFPGVDLDAAAAAVAYYILTNQGQICVAGSRLFVQRSIEAELVAKITRLMAGIVVGDACDASTTFGPIVSAAHGERIMRTIAAGQAAGAELVAGGTRLSSDRGGFFVAPTVFRGVRPDSDIAREEIFGPVLSVTAFDDLEEAIRLANDTRYGLAAFAWTRDLQIAMTLAKRVRAAIYISAQAWTGEGAGHSVSNEPAGESGFGVESGVAGLQSYARRQTVALNHG